MSENTRQKKDDEYQVTTAAIMLIGNEILSGKIKDENAFYLSQRLRHLGVSLEKIIVVPDQKEIIAEEIRILSERFNHVFTSGGVGPTHDDITLESIAYAFNEPILLDSQLDTLLRNYFGERLSEAHLRMAQIPKGSELIWYEGAKWPVYTYKNIYILPGVPQIFRGKFEQIAERFRVGRFYLRSVYLNAGEGAIAELLSQIQKDFEVEVGSYPNVQSHNNYHVRVTIESRQAEQVNLAVKTLIQELKVRLEREELEIFGSWRNTSQEGSTRDPVEVSRSLIVKVDPVLVEPLDLKEGSDRQD